MCASHDVRRVPALVYAASGAYTRIGAVYAPPPDAAYTHMCLYDAVVGAVYAGGCVYASGGCVYAAGAYTHPGAYTRG